MNCKALRGMDEVMEVVGAPPQEMKVTEPTRDTGVPEPTREEGGMEP